MDQRQIAAKNEHRPLAAATAVRFDRDRMHVRLIGEREISVPLKWFPLLQRATPEQRNHWRITIQGKGLRWEEIDEDISVGGLLSVHYSL